jgi:hypothetical protein
LIIYCSEFNHIFEEYLQPLIKARADKDKQFCLSSELLEKSRVLKCPAHIDTLHNYFVVRSVYNYKIVWDGEKFYSPDYDQNFWDNNVSPRDSSNGVISFFPPQLYLFAEQSLNVELVPAFWHKNSVVSNTSVIGGAYDIGRHFRKIECAMVLHEPCDIEINRGDALYYLKFHTNQKIKIKYFHMVNKIKELSSGTLLPQQANSGATLSLKYWYAKNKLFYRRRLLELIKNNLL